MTRVLLVLVLLSAQPVAAGPLARSVAAARFPAEQYQAHGHDGMRSPLLFWIGVALVSGGVVASVGALTWEQQSDLSLEDPSTRLGRDLAPCGTDPAVTHKPIADCKVNQPLLWLGTGLEAAGGVLMFTGSRASPSIGWSGHAVRAGVRVRF